MIKPIICLSLLVILFPASARAQSIYSGGTNISDVQNTNKYSDLQGSSQQSQGSSIPTAADSSILQTKNATISVTGALPVQRSSAAPSNNSNKTNIVRYIMAIIILGVGALLVISRERKLRPEKELPKAEDAPIADTKPLKKKKRSSNKRTQSGRLKKRR